MIPGVTNANRVFDAFVVVAHDWPNWIYQLDTTAGLQVYEDSFGTAFKAEQTRNPDGRRKALVVDSPSDDAVLALPHYHAIFYEDLDCGFVRLRRDDSRGHSFEQCTLRLCRY